MAVSGRVLWCAIVYDLVVVGEKEKRGREGVPPGHDVASWRRVDKELYPPPAPLDEGTVQVVLSRGVRLRSSRPPPREVQGRRQALRQALPARSLRRGIPQTAEGA